MEGKVCGFSEKTLDTHSGASWDEKLQALDGSWLLWLLIALVEFYITEENTGNFYLFKYLFLCLGIAALGVVKD